MWYDLASVNGEIGVRYELTRRIPCVIGMCTLVLIALCLFSLPSSAAAQSGITLTVTPPLYQLSVAPGEVFNSSLTVVNANNFPLSIYIDPVGFSARGERGQGVLERFADAEAMSHHLAGWITLARSQVIIPAGQSETIPFTIRVPLDASPGGHYAALLVSTEPPKPAAGSALSISSSIASLVLMRVKGEVIEQGIVREFSTERALYQDPEAHFTLRFQNTGNTHILPSGMINIYNMWGTERGSVPINQQTDFGNVLPDSVRAFTFTWKSDENVYDFGRYRAVATLAFGDDARQHVTRETTFWVVPVGALIQVVGGGLLLFGLLFYLVRRYIQYALAIETARLRSVMHEHEQYEGEQPVQATASVTTILRPLTVRAVDLRGGSVQKAVKTEAATQLVHEKELLQPVHDVYESPLLPPVWKRLLWAVVFLALVLATIYFVRAYFASVFTYDRAYEVRIDESGETAQGDPLQ